MFLSAWLTDASSLIAAVIIAVWLLWRHSILDDFLNSFRKWSRRPALLCAAIALAPGVLRLILIPWFPIPHPYTHDEFGHLLVADTLLSGRIANPPHPFWQHFDTIYVLQQPSYSSIYPLAQGALLAIGQLVFGHPWFAVVGISVIMNAAVFWVLLALVGPRWAALGCLVASLQLGMMSYWMNSYWGGALAATAGCLVFGGIIRFLQSAGWRTAAWAGIGLAILWHIRPFETAWMTAGCLAYVAWMLIRRRRADLAKTLCTFLVPVGICLVLSLSLMGFHNYRVTGNPLTLPYQLCQKQYGVPVGLAWQPEIPKPELRFKNLADMYEAQRRKGHFLTDWAVFRDEYSHRIQVLWLVYVSPALTIPFIAALVFRPKIGFPVLGFLTFALIPTNLYPFFNAHYIAGYTPLIIALLVLGLKALWEYPRAWTRSLAMAGMLGLAIATVTRLSFLFRVEPDSWQPHWDPWSVSEQLQKKGGKHLVLVRYAPDHDFRGEWVYNRANIDKADVVWAREISPEKDRRLLDYFCDREIWVLDADKWPPTPRPYRLISERQRTFSLRNLRIGTLENFLQD